ncbi:hypothetical protein GCM10011358_06010 [Sinisalibacter lacisalsi]|uniref:Uncharacterized protein n=1 Tax=Sinisalibacter lacisalsi TaxID=1526570 RepID=A0ABQ1QFR1_9RHOB|nr:hypothetical protein GCM10011358_06010 [Sinisalibacter lacisalsi]
MPSQAARNRAALAKRRIGFFINKDSCSVVAECAKRQRITRGEGKTKGYGATAGPPEARCQPARTIARGATPLDTILRQTTGALATPPQPRYTAPVTWPRIRSGASGLLNSGTSGALHPAPFGGH